MKKVFLGVILICSSLLAIKPLYTINFNNGLDGKWRTLSALGGYSPSIIKIKSNNKRFRLTSRTHDLSSAVTLDYEFPTHNNKFIMEFDYYSYGGCSDDQNSFDENTKAGKWGADGMALILYDSSVGPTPRVGASGGSLGYANGNIELTDGTYKDQPGFEGGWLGIGFDEFGAFASNCEARRDINGDTNKTYIESSEKPNSIVIRSDEQSGYRLLLSKQVDTPLARKILNDNGTLSKSKYRTASYWSGRYRLIVDTTDSKHIWITLKRKKGSNNFRDILKFDAKDPKYHLTNTPNKFRIAFSSGTGGGCNNHEIDNIKIYGNGSSYNPNEPKSTSFTCNDTLYFSNKTKMGTGDSNESTMWLHIVDRNSSPYNFISIGEPYNDTYNTLAYNPVDNFLYATYGDHLLKIDKNANVIDLGVIEGLKETQTDNQPRQHYSGVIDRNGIFYIGNWETMHEDEIFKVDIKQKKVVGTIHLKYNGESKRLAYVDMAISNDDKYLYMMQGKTSAEQNKPNQLVKVEIATGNITFIGGAYEGESLVDTIFMDKNNRLFVLYHEGGFYEIDKDSGERRKVSDAPITANLNDGAMCPDAVINIPKVEKPKLLADYHFDNCEFTDDKEGDVKDSAGSSDATAYNGVRSVDGVINRSAKFSGGDFDSASYIENKSPDFNLSKNFTILFTLSVDDVNGSVDEGILSKTVDLVLLRDKRLAIDVNGQGFGMPLFGKSHTLVSNSKLSGWSEVALVMRDGNLTLYINSKYDNSVNIGNIENIKNELLIGKVSYDYKAFSGKLDELKFFSGALSQDDIIKIYSNEMIKKINYDSTPREEEICLSPIGCIQEAIIIDNTKFVHEVDLATGEKTTYTMSDKQINEASINGFGYNIKDGYFWGSNQGRGGYLVRVGKDRFGNYTQEKVGPIQGLPTNKSSYIGDIDKNGHLYLMYKNIPKKNDITIYVIDLNKDSQKYEKVIKSFSLNKNISIADMAFSPLDNQLYTIDSQDNLYKIDIIDKRIKLLKRNIIDKEDNETKDLYGTTFFDGNGFFYALRNRSRDVVRVMFSEVGGKTHIKASFFSSVGSYTKKANIDGGRCNLNPILIDYGDAPDSYHTSLDFDGARHKIDTNRTLYFGNGVTSEPDAWVGDEDIDDGLVNGFKILYTSTYRYSVQLKVKNDTNESANIVGWIDFNRDGVFEEKEGAKTVIKAHTDGYVTLMWNVPNDIKEGETFIRFRVTTDALTTKAEDAYGVKSDGEVEDYKVDIKKGNIFDAWDISSYANISNPVIHTKILKQDIKLYTASINRSRTKEIPYVHKDVKIALFDKNGSIISSYQEVNTTNPHSIVTFKDIGNSSPYVYVKFLYKDDENVTHEINATDPFAIRPDRFNISTENTIKAGKDFNFTISVVDTQNTIVNSFDLNESRYAFDFHEKKVRKCILGELDFNKTDIVHGRTKFRATYNEAGNLEITIYEINGDEFAKIDADDGSGDSRFITPQTKTITIRPDHFKVTSSFENIYGNATDKYAVYSSNDLANSPKWRVKVEAMNKNNQPTKNYNSECVANNVNINFKLDLNSSWGCNTTPTIYLAEDDYTSFSHMGASINSVTSLQRTISKESFDKNATATKEITINFGRNKMIPKAPLKVKFKTAMVKEQASSDVNGTSTPSKEFEYRYLRAFIEPTMVIVGKKEIKAPIYYEAYKIASSRYSKSGESGWRIIDYDTNNPKLYFKDMKAIFSGRVNLVNDSNETLVIKTNHLPERNKIRLKTDPDLEYVTNHLDATVSFVPDSANWAGKGKQGASIDNNISRRSGFKRIDW